MQSNVGAESRCMQSNVGAESRCIYNLYKFYVQSSVQLNLGVTEIVGNVTSVCRGRLRVEQAAQRFAGRARRVRGFVHRIVRTAHELFCHLCPSSVHKLGKPRRRALRTAASTASSPSLCDAQEPLCRLTTQSQQSRTLPNTSQTRPKKT